MFEVVDTIVCRGHRHVKATHPTTFEVTREEDLGPRGDCIIGVGADRAAVDLDDEFKQMLREEGSVLTTVLKAGPFTFEVHSCGSPDLQLDHPTDLVWRRSGYICGRTIGIHSDQTAITLPRELIALLREGEVLTLELHAFIPRRVR
ncbi:MAG: DUF371 domain-containing protein [Methanomicrobiales archaeon]|nr:DUF371 domain-containing protein [Methanomicrobiales archaeon]